jgi:glutathionylspermidine synthase
MLRESIDPRPDWEAKVDALGLLYHQNEDGPYWNESGFYRLTADEVDTLEEVTNSLHEMCLTAVQHVIDENRFGDFGIVPAAVPSILWSWENEPPAIYGRFDLAFNGVDPPKMLEYNADTPTALLEAAVVQWHWLQELYPESDQFNSIWEGLVEKWTQLSREGYLPENFVHFASADSVEDYMTITALRDTAAEAGIASDALLMDEIGWDHDAHHFVDVRNRPISTIFKLYPWEWMVEEEFSTFLFESYRQTQWIEPIWKMLLSNKAILPILWEKFPDHPNLLECYFDDPRSMKAFVEKPLLGREGANVRVVNSEGETATEGEYANQRKVYQRYESLPWFEDRCAVIGSWVIDGVSRGIGIRESTGPITTNLSPFVPHLFD